ncbi:MAG TPA: folate-binding protein [Stellaceae bacterium]|jgi:folate-binding protein YgfZ|nr:folate-binding protein [Stellaceae bacterium]
MIETRFVVLEDRGVLAIGGPERASFLQGLISNDTARISEARAIYAALLTAQGKYLHDFMLVEHGDEIWLDGEAARLTDLKRRLSMFRLRAKVTIDERPDLAVAAIYGDAEAGKPGTAGPLEYGMVFADPRLAALGVRAILPCGDIRGALADIGTVEGDFAEYDRLRLGFGVPDGSRDLALDKSILLESGFDELNGVDWDKGCYIGQELTARTKYRGLIKKRLFPVRIDGPAPEPGALVMLDGHEAGEMRSSRDGVGLALLRLETAGKAGLAAGDARIEPVTPEWMRLPE